MSSNEKMHPEEIQQKLLRIILPFTKIPADQVMETNLEDGDIDSLSLIEIVFRVEEEFGLSIEDDELAQIQRLGDLVRLIGDKAAADHRAS